MVGQQSTTDETAEAGSQSGDRGRAPGIGTLFFLTACGVGLGMLTAPATGQQTRKRLRKGLATLGDEVVDRWGEVQNRLDEAREAGMRAGRRARKSARERLSELREGTEERWNSTQARIEELEDRLERLGDDSDDSERSGFTTAALGMAVGAGLAYFLMAERTAPARSKMHQMANEARQQATNRWEQFRRGGARGRAGARAGGAFGDVDEG